MSEEQTKGQGGRGRGGGGDEDKTCRALAVSERQGASIGGVFQN